MQKNPWLVTTTDANDDSWWIVVADEEIEAASKLDAHLRTLADELVDEDTKYYVYRYEPASDVVLHDDFNDMFADEAVEIDLHAVIDDTAVAADGDGIDVE